MDLTITAITRTGGKSVAATSSEEGAKAFEAQLAKHAQHPSDNEAGAPSAHNQAPHSSGGNWLTRGLGILQAGVGVIETAGGVVGGVLTSETGIGAVAGGAVALHGLDDIQAGFRQAWSGQATETLTQQAATGAARQLGASPSVAMGIGITTDIVAGGGFGSGEKAAVTALEDGSRLLGDGGKAEKGLQDGIKLEEGLQNASKIERGTQDTVKAVEKASSADIDALRAKYSVPEGHTLAAGRTDIPGLEGKLFEGLSPELRKKAGLAPLDELSPDRAIKAPFQNPLFRQHAEEGLLNSVHSDIGRLGLSNAQLEGKTLSLHISNPAGVCNKCTVGLLRDAQKDGVLMQFSKLHPTLTIEITAEGGAAAKGHDVLRIQNGALIP